MNGNVARALTGSLLLLSSCRGLVVQTVLDPITLDQTFEVGTLPDDPCPTMSRELMGDAEDPPRLDIGQDGALCRATLTVEHTTLLSREDVLAIREELADVDVQAIVGVEVIVDAWSLEDASGQPLDLSALSGAAVSLDGTVLFEVSSLASQDAPRVTLPESMRDAVVNGVEDGTAVEASFELELRGSAPTEVLAGSIRVRATLRPVILVDVVDLVDG